MVSDVDKLLGNTASKLSVDVNNEKLASDTVIVLKETMLKDYGVELVNFMMSETRKYKDFNMSNMLLKQIIEVKKAFFPENIISKNLNVDVFSNQLTDWVKVRQSIKNDGKKAILSEVETAIIEVDKNDGR